MTLISATAFKAEVANMATALTAAFKDDTETAVAKEISNPHHPLRRILKYFNFDPATGVVSADDGYIDAAYAGVATKKPNPFDVKTDFPLVLASATADDENTSAINLKYSEQLDARSVPNIGDFTVGGTQTPAVTSVEILGATVIIKTDTTFLNTDTITVDYTVGANPIKTYLGPNAAALSGQAVTNNIT